MSNIMSQLPSLSAQHSVNPCTEYFCYIAKQNKVQAYKYIDGVNDNGTDFL